MSVSAVASRPFAFQDARAIAVAILVTLVIDWLTRLPRILLQLVFTGPPTMPASHLSVCIFLAEAFLCGILTGVLGLLASRRVSPDADPARTARLSTILVLIYGLFTLPLFSAFGVMITLFADQLPSFMPVYLELCGSLPGWILGYYFACGYEAQSAFGLISKLSFSLAASIIVALVFIAPSYVSPNIPRVADEFHSVPAPRPPSPVIRILVPPAGQ